MKIIFYLRFSHIILAMGVSFIEAKFLLFSLSHSKYSLIHQLQFPNVTRQERTVNSSKRMSVIHRLVNARVNNQIFKYVSYIHMTKKNKKN